MYRAGQLFGIDLEFCLGVRGERVVRGELDRYLMRRFGPSPRAW